MQVLITALSLCMRTEEEPAQHASAHHGVRPSSPQVVPVKPLQSQHAWLHQMEQVS